MAQIIRGFIHAVTVISAGMAVISAAADTGVPSVDSQSRSYVKPLDFASLQNRFSLLPERDRELIHLYLQAARRYVLTVEDGALPLSKDNYYRNLAERAHGASVLAAVAGDWPDELKARCRDESVRYLSEFVEQYKKDPLFSYPWQSSWWVGEMGMAAWFVWDYLEPQLQNDAADMIVFHADRIAAQKPETRVEGDTQAETVSWNSTVLSLAVNMMPGHPHGGKWRDAVLHYVYTVFGTSGDLLDETLGDDGRPVKKWVVGANIHDDFSLENHGRFHIEYVFSAYRFMIQGAALFRVGDSPVPEAFRHHIADVHREVVLPCMNASGYAVFVSDNDWKRYHLWTESPVVHGYVALLERSPLAAALEEQSLRRSTEAWGNFPEEFQFDNPYVCGKPWTPRIADIVLLHLLSAPLPDPTPAGELEAQLAGVRRKRDVNLLTQYSKAGSFRSFFWGPGPVVRQIEPKDNAWMLLPLSGNYRTALDGVLKSDSGAMTTCGTGDHWFWVLRTYPHGEWEAFVSLPDEIVVIMNSIASEAVGTIDSSITIEKPYAAFTIYFEAGEATYRYGEEQWDRSDNGAGLNLDSRWVNLSDSIGFVSVNLTKDSPRMVLPEPGVRSALCLRRVTRPLDTQRFLTVAFPNQSHQQTKTAAAQVAASYADGVMTCLAPGYLVWANSSDREAYVELPKGVREGGRIRTTPKSVGFLRVGTCADQAEMPGAGPIE